MMSGEISRRQPELPHSLQIAFDSLIRLLDEAIAAYDPMRHYRHAYDVCDGVKRFSHEYCRISDWKAELRRRAHFIEDACKPGTPFRQAMDSGLKALHDHPPGPAGPEISAARLSIQELRKIRIPTPYLIDVQKLRQTLDRALGDGFVPRKAQQSLRKWREACNVVELDAKAIEAAGCYEIWHVDQAWKADATEQSAAVNAILHSDSFGGLSLNEIKSAAVSLVAWVREQPRDATVATLPPTSVGRDAPAARGEGNPVDQFLAFGDRIQHEFVEFRAKSPRGDSLRRIELTDGTTADLHVVESGNEPFIDDFDKTGQPGLDRRMALLQQLYQLHDAALAHAGPRLHWMQALEDRLKRFERALDSILRHGTRQNSKDLLDELWAARLDIELVVRQLHLHERSHIEAPVPLAGDRNVDITELLQRVVRRLRARSDLLRRYDWDRRDNCPRW